MSVKFRKHSENKTSGAVMLIEESADAITEKTQ